MAETELESLVKRLAAEIERDENWQFSDGGTNDYKAIAFDTVSILNECAEKGKQSPHLQSPFAAYIQTKTTKIAGVCSVVEEGEEEE